jgi:hypothetical protein
MKSQLNRAFSILLASALLFSGCESMQLNNLVSSLGSLVNGVKGDGILKSEDRPLDGKFETLDIQAPIEVEYTQSDNTQSLSLTADSNILPLIQTTLSNNRLLIKLAQSYDTATQVKIVLKGPALTTVNVSAPAKLSLLALQGTQDLNLDVSSAANILVSGARSSTFKLKAIGSSQIDVRDINAKKIEVSLEESSGLTAYGVVESLTLTATGASHLAALNLLSNEANINLDKASKGTLSVKNRLVANLSGASELIYAGDPQITPNLSGASSLKPH